MWILSLVLIPGWKLTVGPTQNSAFRLSVLGLVSQLPNFLVMVSLPLLYVKCENSLNPVLQYFLFCFFCLSRGQARNLLFLPSATVSLVFGQHLGTVSISLFFLSISLMYFSSGHQQTSNLGTHPSLLSWHSYLAQ